MGPNSVKIAAQSQAVLSADFYDMCRMACHVCSCARIVLLGLKRTDRVSPVTPPFSANRRIMSSVKLRTAGQIVRASEWLATKGRFAWDATS